MKGTPRLWRPVLIPPPPKSEGHSYTSEREGDLTTERSVPTGSENAVP